MTKTTIYLPDELKADIAREAKRRGVAEAEVIRTALAAGLRRPKPRPGIISAPELDARKVDDYLVGFGER